MIHERHINSHQYKLFSQDLRETDILRQNLFNLGVDFNAPTLVITECLLVYMKKEDSDRILRAISEAFVSDLAYVNYEMIHPGDPFGRVMLENLEVSFYKTHLFFRTEDANYLGFMIARMRTFRSKGSKTKLK